ncbi:hypothetical protein [Spiroplasma sp. SV19]|uniref:hypothetical protein n=1 Tax=Spiroplasma sp. SV19 TaxID=2570468 RepID=UPI0024B6D2D5|nr:hypothetical protein [Spiroplasma sp. SV19]WHQ36764.1 hypothetical protein E7Y35_02510 [Spiroplasma sp. SV19]
MISKENYNVNEKLEIKDDSKISDLHLGKVYNLVLPMDDEDTKSHPHVVLRCSEADSMILLCKIITFKPDKLLPPFQYTPLYKNKYPCLKNNSMIKSLM